MRNRCVVWLWLIIFGAICSAAQPGTQGSASEQFLGTWSGTWDGAGTGGFELTLEKARMTRSMEGYRSRASPRTERPSRRFRLTARR